MFNLRNLEPKGNYLNGGLVDERLKLLL